MAGEKKSKLPILIAVLALVIVAGVFALIYFLNKPEPEKKSDDKAGETKVEAEESEEGAKAYSLTVVASDGSSKEYEGRTDADYLIGIMDELSEDGDFSYEGDESEYGIYITAINGEVADYSVDQSYWAIYVNDEYGMYGADQQPVNDGDSFKFEYTK